jgi:mono/diheme cytochrome c family protein
MSGDIASGEWTVRAGRIWIVLAVLAITPPVAAQQRESDAAAGRELASKLCSACHIVGAERVGSDVAPPFAAIAKDPEMTLTELHAWRGPSHPLLPNLSLTAQQVADINAYLDTLHDAGAPAAASPGEQRPPLPAAPPDRIGEPIGSPE